MQVKNPLHARWCRAAMIIALAAVVPAHVVRAAPAVQTLVVSSPGSPGTTDEAQPRMDAFAAAVSARAEIPIAAVYEPSDAGGATRLASASLGLVSLPFFLAHERALGLHARLVAVAKGRPALERWALVAARGKVHAAADLAGFTIASSVGFAPAFIRGTVLGGFGALPASAKLLQSTAVLSSLRRAASGEPIAVLLDGTQEAALTTLPFASKLEVVARSPELPAGLVVTIDARLPASAWPRLEAALLGMAADKASAPALDAIQMTGFVAVDDKILTAARKAFADASR